MMLNMDSELILDRLAQNYMYIYKMIETASPGLHGTNHMEIVMQCRLG